jgi:DNA-binding MarR family transcriptional regulator
MDLSPTNCASAVLETTPMIMRSIRAELRKNRSPDLSVPQFRTLAYLGRQGESSLSQVADHIGVALPSASKLVNRLVSKKYAERKTQTKDRRQVKLTLTQSGSHKLEDARRAARIHLTTRFADLPKAELKQIIQAMQIFKTVFACNSQKCHKPLKR